jgi:hypothetical protein
MSRAGEKFVKRSGKIVRVFAGDLFQLGFQPRELVGQHGLEEGHLVREMYIERLFADAQLIGEIIHRDAAKAVTEKVGPGGFNNSLPDGIGRPGFRSFRGFHALSLRKLI